MVSKGVDTRVSRSTGSPTPLSTMPLTFVKSVVPTMKRTSRRSTIFNVLRQGEKGFAGAEAIQVQSFAEAKRVAEEAARNQALRGRTLYQYVVYDRDGRVFHRAPRRVVEKE